MSKVQFTGLGLDGVERRLEGRRWMHFWTETRRNVDDELLAVHTLDFKLGQWWPTPRVANVGMPHDVQLSPSPADPSEGPEIAAAEDAAMAPPGDGTPSRIDDESAAVTTPAASAEPAGEGAPLRRLLEDELAGWQGISLKARGTLPSASHFRVALFQLRADDSYMHPIGEVGVGKLPLGKSSREALGDLLKPGLLKDVRGAAKRGMEFRWEEGRDVISWPEHRRRVLLAETLKACNDLSVQLLVLPEVSVRPDTVRWLKNELRRYPGLAVLAGTYRGFGDTDHLREHLTLLWQPDKPLAEAFGLENDDAVLEFQRGKKYRAVAANELFRPDLGQLAPLFREEVLLEALQKRRSRAGKAALSEAQLIAAIPTLLHKSPKLRYCMELICSELFLLTSPANCKPLWQELARLMKIFEPDQNPVEEDAKKIILRDHEALGEYLTVVQSHRERRSVMLVPACTTRSNDYWHAGQASVLASGTATVFCNAAMKGGAGGSCFIGIDSVTPQPDPVGVVRLLTQYHGWQKGILQPTGQGALSKDDQALVVVDLDPVHVVSGKPRPQLLPEPMSLVAYLPIVELVDRGDNAEGLATALVADLSDSAGERVKSLFQSDGLAAQQGQPHQREAFFRSLQALLGAKSSGNLLSDGGAALDAFAAFFGEPEAVRQRIMVWLKDRHQQPAVKTGPLKLEPAWLDFLVADLTCHGELPTIKVPRWLEEHPSPGASEPTGGRTLPG